MGNARALRVGYSNGKDPAFFCVYGYINERNNCPVLGSAGNIKDVPDTHREKA